MKLKLKDKTYDINVSDWGESIKVVIDDKEYFFVPGPRGKLIPKKETESNYKEELVKTKFQAKEIKSPLTGEVSRVFIRPGDKVNQHQVLLSIFSMKMENEIISPRAAVIEEIKTKQGAKVESGQILIKLK